MLKKLLYSVENTELGKYFISIIFGLGLASLFRKSCENRSCIIFKGPNMKDITEQNYKYGEKCYSFKEKSIKCGTKSKQIQF